MAAISDIIGITDEDTFVRTIYAGNAVQTVKSNDTIKFITVRGTAFPASSNTGGSCNKEDGMRSLSLSLSLCVCVCDCVCMTTLQ